VARRRGIQLISDRPHLLSDVLAEQDFVITVCDSAHEELGDFGDLHWSVPDPVRAGTTGAFDSACADLTQRVWTLAQRLTPLCQPKDDPT